GDDLGGDEVVARQPAAAREVADPAAQRQAAHAGGRDDAAGGGVAEGVGGVVEIAPRRAAAGAGGLAHGVDEHVVDQRQVEHHSAVAGPEAGCAVPAAADGEVEPGLAGVVDGGDDVGGRRGADDQRGPAVVHPVVDAAQLLAVVLARHDDVSTHLFAHPGAPVHGISSVLD